MTELFVIFEIEESAFAIAARQVLQMESFIDATPVPGAAPHVRGLVHVRGRALPVIDVRVRFGLPAAPPNLDRRMVVVERDERAVGLLVDRAREVARIADDDFVPPPEMVASTGEGFVDGVAHLGERTVMRVDVAQIIGEEQQNG